MQRAHSIVLSTVFALLCFAFLQLLWVSLAEAKQCQQPGGGKCSLDSECCDGLVCSGSCKPGCKIDGVFYQDGSLNPANPCQVCARSQNKRAWSNVVAGTSCGGDPSGACDLQNTCNGAGACIDNVQPTSHACRPIAGACDKAESCDGSSHTCPTDSFLPSTSYCRASAGICDTAESCTGNSPTCPVDAFLSSNTQCRASAGACDVAENCSGNSAICPTDVKSSAVCRPAAGVCDVAESCDGVSNDCPVNNFQPATTVCRAKGVFEISSTAAGSTLDGSCDIAENCTGASSDCPVDAVQPRGTTCRTSAGVCDVVESCNGPSANPTTAKDCPANTVKAAFTSCNIDGGTCDGTSGLCCNNICAAGACGLLNNDCGGKKDCGICLGEAVVTGRRCALGLEPDANGICKRPVRSLCTLDNECTTGSCECVSGIKVGVNRQYPCDLPGGICTEIVFQCDGAGGLCHADFGTSCRLDADCFSVGKCENNLCVPNLPTGAECTSPVDVSQCGAPLNPTYIKPEDRHSDECASGWCFKDTLQTAGPLNNGNPVCCRELGEQCEDDADCCKGSFCTDNSPTPLRIRRCLPNANGVKQCSKVSLVGEACTQNSDCYPAGVSCVGGTCTNAANLIRKRGEICANDNGTNKFACESGSICADCRGDGTAGGFRCIAEVNGCCSFGEDKLDECPDTLGQCCNFTCTNTSFDAANCGACGISCQNVPAYFDGGADCWTAKGTCSSSQCGYESICKETNQVCTVLTPATGNFDAITACTTPVTPSLSLFEYAAQQGSYDYLSLPANTAVACQSDADCLSGYSCSNNCNEFIFYMGGSFRSGLTASGVSAACILPGVCLRK